mgnify:CR=1 FL=1
MPSFHEIRFPARLSFGAMGGPERLTEIVTLANGHEERNTPWEHSRRRYDAGLGMRSLDDIAEAVAFFEARRGRLYGFRWKDWGDFRSSRPSEEPHFSDQPIGTGDGARTTFQLVKFYRSGGHRYKRPIRKPVAGSVRVALAGGERVEGTDFEYDADLVLLAMGFLGPEPGTLIDQLGLDTDERSNVRRDSSWKTSEDDVFACGDMGRGQSLIVWAIAEGRSCAAAVDEALMGYTLLPKPVKPTDRPLV